MINLYRLRLLLALSFCAALAAAQENPSVKVNFVNAKGQPAGTGAVTQVPAGVLISLDVTGLTPGPHGFHIHEAGRCDPPDFKTAGGHFNPTKKAHGFKTPKGHHAGDIANLIAGKDGAAHTEVLVEGVKLSDGDMALLRPGGTAIVIHAQPDDYKTDPAGASGDRLVCGVIGKK
jgi:Cu-Zn family superoxide dismutase